MVWNIHRKFGTMGPKKCAAHRNTDLTAVKTGSLIQLFNGSKKYSNVVQLKCGSET
jgi:hypothetical protein